MKSRVRIVSIVLACGWFLLLFGLAKPPSCDADGDGYEALGRCRGSDCDDRDPAVNPGAPEICYDFVDNNCDGAVDEGCGGGSVCGDSVCDAGEGCPECPECCLPLYFEVMDAIGDSVSTGFNAGACTNDDQEALSWSTGDTHGTDYCGAGAEGILSHAETLECEMGTDVLTFNTAESGARMLTDFVYQAGNSAASLNSQDGPRYLTVLLGHNDVCAGAINKVNSNCEFGKDEDSRNYCRTTPDAFEREFRKGLEILIQIPDLYLGIAAPVRVSQLCNHASKAQCSSAGALAGTYCSDLWSFATSFWGNIFGFETGICGSLTRDCSDQRIIDAYETALAYRNILERVSLEYASIPQGGKSARVRIGGQRIGGATKAAGMQLVFSNAPWEYKFRSNQISCCDCFHPSLVGQDKASQMLFTGFACSETDLCCSDTGDPYMDGLCVETRPTGEVPGFFVPMN